MKNDIIFWKGSCPLALSKKSYSCLWSKEKTVIMNIDKTIRKIKETVNLNVIGSKSLD